MNRRQMLARLKQGEDPLELSIEKWRNIVDGKGEDLRCKNCALCEVSKLECSNCLVSQKTQLLGCMGTPYHDYLVTKTQEDALRELEFLKSLRKEEAKL